MHICHRAAKFGLLGYWAQLPMAVRLLGRSLDLLIVGNEEVDEHSSFLLLVTDFLLVTEEPLNTFISITPSRPFS